MRSIAVGNGGGGDLVTNGTYDVNFTGSGGLLTGNHNEGTNVLLTGNNSFTGPSGIMTGKLMISSSANLGAATTSFIAVTGTLDILGNSFTSFGQHTVAWGSIVDSTFRVPPTLSRLTRTTAS